MILSPSRLLRLEGLAVLLAGSAVYLTSGAALWLFPLALLAPDLSMLGYLAGPRVGATVYNLAHTYAAVLAAGALAVVAAPGLVPYAALWAAHVGMDRAVGYGLKYDTGFEDTHAGRLAAAEVRTGAAASGEGIDPAAAVHADSGR